MRIVIWIILVLSALPSSSQNWEAAGLPFTAFDVRKLYTDTVENKLYAMGNISTTGSNGSNIALCIYDGSSWSYLATFNDIILNCVTYNGDVIVSGAFSIINGQPIQYLARWDGVSWQQLGGNLDGGVYALKVFNGELYVGGNFTQIDGQNIPALAKWNGTLWAPVNNFPGLYGGAISCMEMYQGDLYVGGWMATVNGIHDIAMCRNNVWQRVGVNDTLRGGFTGVAAMTIYKNELIVGGLIPKNDGNIGNALQKWNGFNWSSLGTCVQDQSNTTNGNVQVWDFLTLDQELYVAGTFYYAGNVPSQKIARWDGNYWCALGGVFDNNALAVGSLNDTLYVGCGDTVDGIFVNNLARWIGGSFIDTCSAPMSVEENQDSNPLVNVYPNPTTENFTLSSEDNDVLSYTVFNELGAVIVTGSFKGQTMINTKGWQKGMYFIRIFGKNFFSTQKVIKN